MTLVELLVVMAVIGLIVGISVPAFTGYAKQIRLKTAVRQVMGLVSLARNTAISGHQEYAVVVDGDNQILQIVNVASGDSLEHVVHLPSHVTVELQVGGEPAEDSQFVFRPTGALTGRTISLVLSDGDRQQAILVTGATGAVIVQ